MLLKLIEFVAVVFICWTFLSQIAVPIIRGTKLFPILRKEFKLKQDLSQAKQEEVEKDLQNNINKIREGLK